LKCCPVACLHCGCCPCGMLCIVGAAHVACLHCGCCPCGFLHCGCCSCGLPALWVLPMWSACIVGAARWTALNCGCCSSICIQLYGLGLRVLQHCPQHVTHINSSCHLVFPLHSLCHLPGRFGTQRCSIAVQAAAQGEVLWDALGWDKGAWA
jgi:hypothetical protein